MRRIVVIKKHPDDDTEKAADLWHRIVCLFDNPNIARIDF